MIEFEEEIPPTQGNLIQGKHLPRASLTKQLNKRNILPSTQYVSPNSLTSSSTISVFRLAVLIGGPISCTLCLLPPAPTLCRFDGAGRPLVRLPATGVGMPESSDSTAERRSSDMLALGLCRLLGPAGFGVAVLPELV